MELRSHVLADVAEGTRSDECESVVPFFFLSFFVCRVLFMKVGAADSAVHSRRRRRSEGASTRNVRVERNTDRGEGTSSGVLRRLAGRGFKFDFFFSFEGFC